MEPDDPDRSIELLDATPPAEGDDEPPVVARLVVEIRSDGTRTIARGAIEDRNLGQAAGMKIEAKTPAALARQLMRALLSIGRLGTGDDAEPRPRRTLPRLARRLNPFRRN